MRISREVKYKLGDMVILKANPELSHIVTGYIIRHRSITYGISDGEEESWHSVIEIEPTQKSHKVKGFKGQM
jgi:hypothetical protein